VDAREPIEGRPRCHDLVSASGRHQDDANVDGRTMTVDTDWLQRWVGKTETASERLSPELVRRFSATLDLSGVDDRPGAEAPLAIHWCLAAPTVATAQLGADGHPQRGGFLPPVPLPRRMWAGGELVFSAPLRIGDLVRRESVIDDVVLKEGASGPLCFVTVRHTLSTDQGIAIRERHDIVYRDAPDAASAATPPQPAKPRISPGPAMLQRSHRADPVLLFRYSALTFNGHRIHYDRSYCVEVEKYPGLVFHGPLQATLLLHLAQGERARTPAVFSFRSIAPLFDGGEIGLNAHEREDGKLALWTTDQTGDPCMLAEAEW
jgi:3-methylfumaryl-CoA hydratase